MVERVSIDQAAHRLAISTKTVRRRIRDGTLDAERVAVPQGFRYWVLLPDEGKPEPEIPHRVDADQLLDQVTAERDWLRRQVEEHQTTIDRLTSQAENFQVLLRQSQEALLRASPRQESLPASNQVGRRDVQLPRQGVKGTILRLLRQVTGLGPE